MYAFQHWTHSDVHADLEGFWIRTKNRVYPVVNDML